MIFQGLTKTKGSMHTPPTRLPKEL
jgi:hypothetical protein